MLADEINRAPAKVQSALLEVMAEHQVSIGGQTFPVPEPFLVLATQNPIESEGVYPLPEAQRDRFLMKIVIDYPTPREEVEIVYRMGVQPARGRRGADARASSSRSSGRPTRCTSTARSSTTPSTSCSPPATPSNYGLADIEPLITYGASPRRQPRPDRRRPGAGPACGAATYVLPQDVFDVAPDVLRHRLVLSYEALAQGVTADQILGRVLSTVPAPRVAPSQDPATTRPPISARPPVPAGARPGAAAPAVGAAARRDPAPPPPDAWAPADRRSPSDAGRTEAS